MNNGSVYWVGQDGNIWIKGIDSTGNWNTWNAGPASGSKSLTSTGFYDPWAGPESAGNEIFYNATQIADPKTSGQVLGDTTTSGSTSGPSNQQAIDLANSALGRIPTQLDIALGNIAGQYSQKRNALTSGLQNATQQFQQGQTQNQQAYRTGQNQVNQNASQDRMSLLRVLAGMGAGGGSEAQYLVPSLVGNVAAKGLGQAGQTFAGNAQGLNTNFNLYKKQNEGEMQNLADWQVQQQNAARSTADQNKISLLQTLAGLQANPTAAQPYIDQINALSGQVDQLQAFNPSFSGNVPSYTPPALSKFTPAGNQQVQVNARGNAQGGVTPYLNLIQGIKDKLQPSFGF